MVNQRAPRVSGKRVLAALERNGWYVDRVRGSHHQPRHPDEPGTVTVAVHGTDILTPKSPQSILDQASMTVDELIALL